MMREIKFRAWHTNEDMFFVGDDFGTTHPLDCVMYAKQGQPVILMQYTGLKDKNGKEIFEGDIYFDEGISYWGSHCVGPYKNYRVVEYNTERAQFVARHHCGYENIDTTKEIMGNIHENSELLK